MRALKAACVLLLIAFVACRDLRSRDAEKAEKEKKEDSSLGAAPSGGRLPRIKPSDFGQYEKLVPPACPSPAYQTPNPDRLNTVWSGRQRYRLVIGAGKYPLDSSADRPFVAETAREVDAALQSVGYSHSLGLLLDKDATSDKITAAIEHIGSLPTNALVVIYYIGHGIPLDGDLAISVANRKVTDIDGVSVRQLLAKALKPFDPQFRKIPRIVFVLESCYSGAAKPFSISRFLASDEFKRLAFLTATSATQTAVALSSPNRFAFGHFFAVGLQSEWSCADRTPDGAITALEMRTYIAEKLKAAFASGTIPSRMTPDVQDAGLYSTIAYDPARVADQNGYRNEIVDLYLEPAEGVTAAVKSVEGQAIAECVGTCTISTDSPAETVATFFSAAFGTVSIPGSSLLDGETKFARIGGGRLAVPTVLGSVRMIKTQTSRGR
jgi:hypothetical protein